MITVIDARCLTPQAFRALYKKLDDGTTQMLRDCTDAKLVPKEFSQFAGEQYIVVYDSVDASCLPDGCYIVDYFG